MRPLYFFLVFFHVGALWSNPVNPEPPKLYGEQEKVLGKPIKSLDSLPLEPAPGLYRSWINPVGRIQQPSHETRVDPVIKPSVRNPVAEQTFLKKPAWKSGKAVHVYEKRKDFEKLLNPFSLKDLNRFVYQRNPQSP